MKRLALIAAVIASTLACLLMLAGCGAQSVESAQSGTLVTYQNKLYYAAFGVMGETDVEIDDATQLPLETDNFLIYQDTVYYTDLERGTDGLTPLELHAAKLDGSDEHVLATNVVPGTFYRSGTNLVFEQFGATTDETSWCSVDASDDQATCTTLGNDVRVIASDGEHLFVTDLDATTGTTANVKRTDLTLADDVTLYQGDTTNKAVGMTTTGDIAIIDEDGMFYAFYAGDGSDTQARGGCFEKGDPYPAIVGIYVVQAFPNGEVLCHGTDNSDMSLELATKAKSAIDVYYVDDKRIIYACIGDAGVGSHGVANDNTYLFSEKIGSGEAINCGSWFTA